MTGRRDAPASLDSLYTDIQWIKESLSEIKESIKAMNDMNTSIQQRLAAVEAKTRMHDKIIYAFIGATASGFVSLIIWIMSVIA